MKMEQWKQATLICDRIDALERKASGRYEFEILDLQDGLWTAAEKAASQELCKRMSAMRRELLQSLLAAAKAELEAL